MTIQPIQDENERQRALNPALSFIVQAPAGSGKTELLTQRFLLLLGLVSVPEEILAITFTKKAAAEMRARIINTLKNAAIAPEPEAAHAKKTWHLAKKALQQNTLKNWNLLTNPNRLRIQTIDSFNASLVKHLPILSRFGAAPDITDDPVPLYREAVQEFLSHLEENVEWADAIAQLLTHRDNDLQKVQQLLVQMLAKRDQWLPYIMIASDQPTLREELEAHLASVVEDTLANLLEHFPQSHRDELLTIARFAANNLRASNTSSTILNCLDMSVFPGCQLTDRSAWHGLSELLLTKDKTWRKKTDKNLGFPAPSSTKNKEEKSLYQTMKQRYDALIAHFSQDDKFYFALCEFNWAPAHQYEDKQWQALDALYQVLRVIVAQLTVVFRNHSKIDYIENAQAALLALGTEEAPTDLALSLDYQIRHILIDEFQDTSNSQYRLIQKLTAGWETNDGRTLFVVGDPMQSIYRFREAEVGLFIRARQSGIGNVKLEPLTLSVNFRSTPDIVGWVNDHFNRVLPAFEDIASGAVAYSQSMANSANNSADSFVKIHLMKDAEYNSQAEAIVKLIQQLKREKPGEKIAILVRARTHLEYIIPSLKKAGLPYRAIKIDPLSARPVIQDLIALTRALLNPADRVAWLAILRAPWCGLTLNDLFIIANHDAQQAIFHSIGNTDTQAKLSADGKPRLSRFLSVISPKTQERKRYTLRLWVESTWLLLGGPACLDQAADIDDVAAFFSLLEKLDQGSSLPKLDNLDDDVSKLFAVPNNAADDSLQIMTIHNAKGLEFDSVILPYLERQPPNDRKQLLLWMEKPRAYAENALILAPIQATGATTDSIYAYIKKQHAVKTDHEIGRLLYVAATRAKNQLHLFSSPKYKESYEIDAGSSKLKSLLEKLWVSIKHEVVWQDNTALFNDTANDQVLARTPKLIKRLTANWHNPVTQSALDNINQHQKLPGFQLPDVKQKRVGTLIHRLIEQITQHGISWWESKNHLVYRQNLLVNLMQCGVGNQDLQWGITRVYQAMDNMLGDARGRWILQSHTDHQSEFALSTLVNSVCENLVIDRTFIDEDGVRWIIDYKTSSYHEGSLEEFLQTEHDTYAAQLEKYARAFRQLESRPIKLGLYFPLVSGWLEWAFATNTNEQLVT